MPRSISKQTLRRKRFDVLGLWGIHKLSEWRVLAVLPLLRLHQPSCGHSWFLEWAVETQPAKGLLSAVV